MAYKFNVLYRTLCKWDLAGFSETEENSGLFVAAMVSRQLVCVFS